MMADHPPAVSMSSSTTNARLPATLYAALALHCAFAFVTWFVPPAMNSDSATGFYVWDCWRAGAPWNHMIGPDIANIARDSSIFQAWWSPGQYLVVAPWQLLGLTLGHAIAVGGGVATAIALIGFWRLFRTFGFGISSAGWAVLSIACNWTMTRTYGDYMGGETALLAVLPWLVLAARWAFASERRAWLTLPALYWVGAMAKNSYIPIGAGLIAGFRGNRLWERSRIVGPRSLELARWLSWFALGHLLFWASYLRLGFSPAAALGGQIHPDWWVSFLRIVAFPISAIFSVGNVLGRIFLFPSHPLVAELRELWPVFLPMAIVGAGVLVWLLKREFALRPAWAQILVGVIAANLAFYALVGLGRSTDGLEERFFKPVGFLLLPALVDAVRGARPRWIAWLLGGALGLSSTYGVASYANRAQYLHHAANEGLRGTTQNLLSREGLSVLQMLDESLPGNSIVVLPSPEMTLELRRTRRLSTHAAQMTLTDLATHHYRGRVDNLVVLANNEMLASGQARALLATFADYPADTWTIHRYGEWMFFHCGSFSGWPAPNSFYP